MVQHAAGLYCPVYGTMGEPHPRLFSPATNTCATPTASRPFRASASRVRNHRAQRRLRPRPCHPDPSRPRRRRLGHQRKQGLHIRRTVGRLGHRVRPHQPRDPTWHHCIRRRELVARLRLDPHTRHPRLHPCPALLPGLASSRPKRPGRGGRGLGISSPTSCLPGAAYPTLRQTSASRSPLTRWPSSTPRPARPSALPLHPTGDPMDARRLRSRNPHLPLANVGSRLEIRRRRGLPAGGVNRQATLRRVLARVVDRSLQIHGGYGVTQEMPFERWYREARVRRIGEGAQEVNKILIAREILNPGGVRR